MGEIKLERLAIVRGRICSLPARESHRLPKIVHQPVPSRAQVFTSDGAVPMSARLFHEVINEKVLNGSADHPATHKERVYDECVLVVARRCREQHRNQSVITESVAQA